MNLTIAHCYTYLRSLHPADVCGIRGNSSETLIARVAKHATGKSQRVAYTGGDILWLDDGRPHRLSPQISWIAQAFEECKTNDFGAYDVDEHGLTAHVYTRLPCGKWFNDYRRRDALKAYSPDVYRRYYQKPRRKAIPVPDQPF